MLAAGRGLLSVVGVLGSLYPAFTVVLARFVLHERLTRAQGAGVAMTLAGVVALAAGLAVLANPRNRSAPRRVPSRNARPLLLALLLLLLVPAAARAATTRS